MKELSVEDDNYEADLATLKEKKSEYEGKLAPIMSSLRRSTAMPEGAVRNASRCLRDEMPSEMPSDEPTIEERLNIN